MPLSTLIVSTIEQATRLNARLLTALGWYPAVVGYGGYGNSKRVRIMGRVLMGTRSDERNWLGEKRGWRQYFDAQVPGCPVLVSLGKSQSIFVADRGGYLDAELDISDLKPGWHTAHVRVLHAGDLRAGRNPLRVGQPTGIPVRVVGEDERTGIISDVDDTIMLTMVPEPLQALRYVLVEHSSRRQSIAGMSALLKELQILGLQVLPPSSYTPLPPVFYLSNGARNVASTLRRFLARERFPQGNILLRPWGISERGLPPRGVDHKLSEFARIRKLLPNMRWFLVGDNGEYDPYIYQRIAAENPDAVLGILIRTLSGTEHFALHGTPRPHPQGIETKPDVALELQGRSGFALLKQVRSPSTRAALMRNMSKGTDHNNT